MVLGQTVQKRSMGFGFAVKVPCQCGNGRNLFFLEQISFDRCSLLLSFVSPDSELLQSQTIKPCR